MRSFLSIALVLAACSSSKQAPASSKPVVAGPTPTASVAPGTSPTASDGRCRDGWRATQKGWLGAGAETTTIECKHGVATLTIDTMDAHWEEGDPETPAKSYALSRDVWTALWEQLEKAHWRELAATCVEPGSDAVDTDYTDVDLEISDGKTTKVVKCGMQASSYHLLVMEAFEQTTERATEPQAGPS